MRGLHGDNFRNLGGRGDHRSAAIRNAENDLPGVLTRAEEEIRPVPCGDVQGGRTGLALLALRLLGRGVH